MNTPSPVVPKLGKSTLSMYLRTNCDRELYLSLFQSSAAKLLEQSGMPPALSARPNIQLITADGIAFERQEIDMLHATFPAACVRSNRNASGDYGEIDLKAHLQTVIAPCFLIHPEIKPDPFRGSLLTQDFGLTAAEEALIPSLAGFIPDIVLLRTKGSLQWELLPSGKRRLLAPNDSRLALSVIDLKNTIESNRSYAAEVVLYSIVLAKWLVHEGLQSRFFISDECFLWTTREKAAFAALPATASVPIKVAALVSALERLEVPVIAPSVVKFFKEDIPRVMLLAAKGGWKATEYHVGPRCSSCDWLGYERWLNATDKAYVAAHPGWYCRQTAQAGGHLSQMPSLSRGARMILEQNGVPDLTGLSTLPAASPTLSRHALLKRERSQLAPRASAILTNSGSIDNTVVLSGIAGRLELEVVISVNFDSAAGLLTGLALRATLFMPFGSQPPLRQLADWASPVDSQASTSEWTVLMAFLLTLETVVQQAKQHLGGSDPKTQLIFWEIRQFEELCAAVGRHLSRIMALGSGRGAQRSTVPALALLFPPEEVLEREAEISPHIVFLCDAAQLALRYPIPHAFTLRAVHEQYHLLSLAPRRLDNYFIDPLGNGIPRERIYEVWKNTGTIRRGAAVITKAQAEADYLNALKSHTLAIASIAAKLRQDFKGRLKGSAPQLAPRGFLGARGVAFDSKLWIQWDGISAKTDAAERKVEFTLPCERLEAGYKALHLTGVVSTLSPNRYVYSVSADSAEAKLDDQGAWFVLGDALSPGLPLQTAALLGLPFQQKYVKISAQRQLNTFLMPLFSLLRARIHNLDRVRLTADIEFLPRMGSATDVVQDLITSGRLPIARGEIFVMEGKPPDQSDVTDTILGAVGNPPYATADPQSIRALGIQPAATRGSSSDTPLARVLWDAATVAAHRLRTAAQGKALATRASALVPHGLDASQQTAVEDLAQQQLALVWGPPGTGKTTTLVGYLQALIEEAIAKRSPRKILISSMSYRAVEVLVHQLVEDLNGNHGLPCDVGMVYSRSRQPIPYRVAPAPHVRAIAVSLADPSGSSAIQAAYSAPSVAIFGTAAHTVPALMEVLGATGALDQLFDALVIDESSQVPVTLALRPLAAISKTAQIVIAGDRKQMPPIHSLAPPVGAEHLVGSIHGYLLTRFAISEQRLLVNYRSADHLVDFAKTLDYDAKLAPHVAKRRLRYVSDPATILLPGSLPASQAWAAVLDEAKVVTTLLHEDPSSSQANHTEAKMVTALAYILRRCVSDELAPSSAALQPFASDDEFFNTGLGIVTPHKAQRALIIAELAGLFPAVSRAVLEESVDTVERFQGGQRHTIIVSFGVGDVDVIQGEEEFLLQMERANVAISRARAKCIVIMPRSLAYHLPSDAAVAKTATALKSYVEEFCSHRQRFFVTGAGPEIEVRWH